MRLGKPSPAMIVALLALMVALGGTAIAADHYIITSSSQIKPSVLKALRGSAGPEGSRGSTGPEGKPGPEGKAGPEGKTGPEGKPGASGTLGPEDPGTLSLYDSGQGGLLKASTGEQAVASLLTPSGSYLFTATLTVENLDGQEVAVVSCLLRVDGGSALDSTRASLAKSPGPGNSQSFTLQARVPSVEPEHDWNAELVCNDNGSGQGQIRASDPTIAAVHVTTFAWAEPEGPSH
jgi:hypothetical protein